MPVQSVEKDSGMDQKNQLIREDALRRLLSISHSTLFRWERDGHFPPRIKIGSSAVAWRLSDVEEWLRERTAGNTGDQANGEHESSL
jgi:prophage regulatory protein